jgi:PadR family transcriptional regulator PadR
VAESLDVQLKKGVLNLCVLAVLSRGESYAYEIAQQLTEQIGMGEGTIYPLMRRLQNDGLVESYLVESSTGPSRKYYKLTKAGRAAYQKQKTTWTVFARAVDGICKEPGRVPRDVHRRSA